MKMIELRKMGEGELRKMLAASREQIRDLNFKIHSKEVKNNHLVKSVKKDIARILTVLNGK
jgi:large subunit ribosomal protein L29